MSTSTSTETKTMNMYEKDEEEKEKKKELTVHKRKVNPEKKGRVNLIKNIKDMLKETVLRGIQNESRFTRPNELAMLDSKYEELAGKTGVDNRKVLEQLLLSVVFILLHDPKTNAMHDDRFLRFIYTIREHVLDTANLINEELS